MGLRPLFPSRRCADLQDGVMFVLQNISSLAHHRLPLIYCMDGMIKHGTDGAVGQIFRIIERLWGRAKRYCHLVNAPPRNSAAAARSFTDTAEIGRAHV